MIVAGLFLALACFVLPLLSWSSYRQLSSAGTSTGTGTSEAERPTSRSLAVQGLVLHALVLNLALASTEVLPTELVAFTTPGIRAWGLALAVLVAFVILARLESRRPLAQADTLRRELRRSALDAPWLAVMLLAAVTEEVAYRGVLFGLLSIWMAPALAATLAAVVFGLGHLSQGRRGAVLATAFAGAMQALYLIGGSLFLPVLCHLLYDLVASWLGRRRASEEHDESVG